MRLTLFTVLFDFTMGARLTQKLIWLRSTWDVNGVSRYAFSTDGKSYHSFGGTYRLTWGSYRGDRIGFFNFNTKEDKGYVDVDWFQYDYGVIGKNNNKN